MADEHAALRRRTHHVPLPKWFLWARVIQLVIAMMCAGLAAYVSSQLPWFETSDLMIFVGFATAAAMAYVLLATTVIPLIYNFWLILLLEILSLIFWTCAFLALAFEIAIVTEATKLATKIENKLTAKYLGHEFSVDLFEHTKMAGDAACIFGAVIFIMFFVTLITFSIRLRRFRRGGGKAFPSNKRSLPVQAGWETQMETAPNMEPITHQSTKDYVVYNEVPVSDVSV